MQILKQSTSAQSIKLGPFVDSTDGVTAETGLTIANTDIQIAKAGGAFGNKTSGGGTHDADGWYTATLDATDTATVGILDIQVTVAGALPVMARFQVVEEAIYDGTFASGATALALDSKLDTIDGIVDAVLLDTADIQPRVVAIETDTSSTIPGTITTLQADTDDIQTRLPAALTASGQMDSDLSGISSGSAAISTIAASFTKVSTEPETGTYTNTHQLDGTLHQVEDVAGDTDFYYEFDVGGNGIPVSMTWDGYANSNGDSYTIWAYNYGITTYEMVGTIDGTSGSTVIQKIFDLTASHVGTAANVGKVRFRVLSADGTKFATDRVLCSYAVVAQSVGYANGAIWVNANDGTAGTESYVNGTADNPVTTWADALTLSSQLNIKQFEIANGTTITLTANSDGFVINGNSSPLILNGQSFSGGKVSSMHISGICAGANQIRFDACSIGTATIPASVLNRCGLIGPVTFNAAGDYYLIDCVSQVAGASSPSVDLDAAVGAQNLSVRRFGGGLSLTNIAAGDVISAEATVGGTLTLAGAAGTVEARGGWKQVSSGSFSGTLVDVSVNTQLAVIDGNVDDILVDTAEIANLNDFDPTTDAVATVTDITNEVTSDVTAINGSASSAVNLAASTQGIISDVVATGTPTTTTCTLTNAPAVADVLIGRVIVVTSGARAGEAKAITGYTSGRVATFDAMSGAVSVSDVVVIV